MTAIITGSGRGIGKEIAILLARKAVDVVVCARSSTDVRGVVDQVNQMPEHSRILGIKCNVSDSREVNLMVSRTLDEFGGVDILVNNAGIAIVKKLVDTSDEEWDQTIDSNLKSAFLCSRAVVPHMVERSSGVIINVSSGAGKHGFENLSAYCASKFGMIGLTKSLAWELAAYHDIRVMSVCPGEVATKMQKDADPDYYRLNKSRMLQPQQVAETVVQMIFDKNFQNGQSVDIVNLE